MQSNEKQAAMNFFQRIVRRLGWITEVAGRLAADSRARVKLLAVGLWFLLTDDLKPGIDFRVRLRKFGQEFDFLVGDLEHYSTLLEVFVDEVYHVSGLEEPRVIFDLGSNIGASILYFCLRYPGARTYCFEPDQNNFRYLEANTRGREGVHLRRLAVWSRNADISFYADPHRGAASSVLSRHPRQEKQRVEAKTLDTLMRELRLETIDLLKFDVEGAEFEIFRRFENRDRVRTYVGELHEDMGSVEIEDILRLFEGRRIHLDESALGCHHVLIEGESGDAVPE